MSTCLGSGRYTAQIRHLDGKIVEEIDPSEILEGEWTRAVSATSHAHISIPLTGNLMQTCCKYVNLGKGIPAYELWLWRDVNGDDLQLTWVGPITDISIEQGNLISIDAHDHSFWLTRRLLPSSTHVGEDVNAIANSLISEAYAINNPGNVSVLWEPAAITGEKSPVVTDGSKVLDAVTDVVRGVSYWTCNMKQFRIGVNTSIAWQFTDEDLPETPPLSWSADNFSTAVFARTSTDGISAYSGGIDTTTFGTPILLESVIDANTTTIPEAQVFADKRRTNVSSTGPRLEALRSALSPQTGIQIDELWPGAQATVLFDVYCDPVQRHLYLTQVECTWNADDEDIRLELSPNIGDSNDPRVAGA